MKVILLRDVARIGRRFEIKEVPSGHALNFLIPRKLAEPATEENLKRIRGLTAQREAALTLETEQFGEALKRLKETKVTISVDANAQGHLFKGVRADDIAKALHESGFLVDSSHIELSHPIKELGTHEVHLHSGSLKGSCTLEIVAKK